MIARTPVALPPEAQAKLAELQMQRMAAEDALRGIAGRLSSLPRDADQMRAALETERDRQSRRHNELHRLINAVQQWLTQLRPGTLLEPAPPVDVSLKTGEKLTEAIDRTRKEIAMLRQQIASTQRAPLPLADQKKLAQEYVARLWRQARPTVSIVGDTLRVGWRGDCVMAEDTAALLAWIAPHLISEAISSELAALPERADALSVQERMRRLSELEAALLRAESQESALIMLAAEDGTEISRRHDMDPRCVLGVVIAAAKEATAA
jgi:hypothetical protein